jgi:hypothetical protein
MMMHKQSTRWMPLVTLPALLLVISLCVLPAQAAQAGRAVHPELLQKLLSTAGLSTEIFTLDRADGFAKGILIENVRDVSLMIGFPGDGIQKGTPFLLSIEGQEVVAALSEEGELIVIAGEEALVPAGILDFVECILDTVDVLLEGIDNCGVNPICIIEVTFELVIDILECIL